MWLSLFSENHLKFAKMVPNATIGSAESNSIGLEGAGIRSLQGQFFENPEGEWSYRDFSSTGIRRLQEGDTLSFGGWKATLLSSAELIKRHQLELVQSFKKFLKGFSPSHLDDALRKLQNEFFLNASLPTDLEVHLRSSYREYNLLGPVEQLLLDPAITDILIEDFNRIWVEQNGALFLSDALFSNSENYQIYLENLLTGVHKNLDEFHPFLDFSLPGGVRGHVIGPPLTDGKFYLSIRKPRTEILDLESLCDRGMFSREILQKLNQCLLSRRNILISGATGAGKTSLLRALLKNISFEQRVIVIEDIEELKIPRENTVYLHTRIDSRGHLPAVQMRDLVRQSLRMRPDRILIGEVRGEEALDLLYSMNTGHRGCLGSLHANSARDALHRLQGLIQMSGSALSEKTTRDLIARNLHIVLHCEKDSSGKRKLKEWANIRGLDNDQILLEMITC